MSPLRHHPIRTRLPFGHVDQVLRLLLSFLLGSSTTSVPLPPVVPLSLAGPLLYSADRSSLCPRTRCAFTIAASDVRHVMTHLGQFGPLTVSRPAGTINVNGNGSFSQASSYANEEVLEKVESYKVPSSYEAFDADIATGPVLSSVSPTPASPTATVATTYESVFEPTSPRESLPTSERLNVSIVFDKANLSNVPRHPRSPGCPHSLPLQFQSKISSVLSRQDVRFEDVVEFVGQQTSPSLPNGLFPSTPSFLISSISVGLHQ